jgi:hypothetical protein
VYCSITSDSSAAIGMPKMFSSWPASWGAVCECVASTTRRSGSTFACSASLSASSSRTCQGIPIESTVITTAGGAASPSEIAIARANRCSATAEVGAPRAAYPESRIESAGVTSKRAQPTSRASSSTGAWHGGTHARRKKSIRPR